MRKKVTAVESDTRQFMGWMPVFFVLIILVLSLITYWQLPPQIPLFFGLAYGPNQLAVKNWFFVLPSLSVALFIVNKIFDRAFVSNEVYTAMLFWLQLLGQFLIIISILHVLALVA